MMPTGIRIRLSEACDFKVPVAGAVMQRVLGLFQTESRFRPVRLDALDVILKQRMHLSPLVIGEHRDGPLASPAIVGLGHGTLVVGLTSQAQRPTERFVAAGLYGGLAHEPKNVLH